MVVADVIGTSPSPRQRPPLDYAPIFGWLLLISAWAKRLPFLWAFMPMAAIGIVERSGLRLAGTQNLRAWFVHDHELALKPCILEKGGVRALMKMIPIGYWIATVLIGLETLAGGAIDLVHGRTSLVSGPFVLDIITHLGYPPYLLMILGFWKLLGAMVLFAPGLPRLKEWAYAGIFFELSGAASSWALHGDKASEVATPLILTIITLVSWALRPQSRTLGVLFSAKARA